MKDRMAKLDVEIAETSDRYARAREPSERALADLQVGYAALNLRIGLVLGAEAARIKRMAAVVEEIEVLRKELRDLQAKGPATDREVAAAQAEEDAARAKIEEAQRQVDAHLRKDASARKHLVEKKDSIEKRMRHLAFVRGMPEGELEEILKG